MYKKIIPILVIFLLITSVAFATNNSPQISIDNEIGEALNNAYQTSGITPVVVNGVVYIPISEVENFNKPLNNMPEAVIITDIDTAYQTLTDLHERFLDRIKNYSTAKTKDENIKLLEKNLNDTFYDIGLLSSIQVNPNKDKNISLQIFFVKNFLHATLTLYVQSIFDALNGIQNNDKSAKKEIETIKPTFALIGEYTDKAFKVLDESYKEYQKAKQGN